LQAHSWVASNLSLWPSQPIRQLSGSPPGPRQPPFGVGHEALSTGLAIPRAFRQVAFASWAVLFPLRVWAVLPKIARLTGWVPDRIGGCHVPHQLRCSGRGCLLYCAAWVPPYQTESAVRFLSESSSHQPSVETTFRNTAPRRFMDIHPSRLSLAWFAWMAQAPLGLHPPAFAHHVTGALARVGKRPGHWSGQG
jgi:hypothetical protein